jgi:hypothetical protein
LIEGETQIVESDEQSKKAPLSMRDSLEPDSNVTRERAWQSEKEESQIISTEAGMQIVESAAHL